MSRSETFQTLLDKCESEVQRHIILAQLAMLRRMDAQRKELAK